MRVSEPLRRAFREPGATEDQLDFEWSRIRNRIEPSPFPVGRRVAQAALVAGIAAVVFVATSAYLSGGKTPVGIRSLALQGPTTTTLSDGSRIAVPVGSKVRISEKLAESVRVDIDVGEAEFDVTHKEGRTFTVAAAGVDVRVVGTQFKVGVEERASDLRASVRVAVSRGAVDVTTPALQVAVRVQAGQEQLFGAEREQAQETTPPSEMPQPGKAVENPLRTPTDAQRLFEQANLARRAGRAGEAAHLYQVLLSRFPHNRRAGLAALELGRLRMDTLGDLSGAAEALRRAIRTIHGGSLHEDAQARLVDALDGLHDWSGCRRARKDYLRLYRHGVHAIAVDARCATR